jgi:hypothetical protein
MKSLVVGVAGVVVGAVGTRLVHHPEQVAHELHEAAAFASGEAPRGFVEQAGGRALAIPWAGAGGSA